ncbi:MAG: formylglycine-generating enzyme family protein [Candidatus Wallbacteria bacterium]|nr:formylglycine-generating enzyme family protein [Candidatus Wallbacteria bacterium]
MKKMMIAGLFIFAFCCLADDETSQPKVLSTPVKPQLLTAGSSEISFDLPGGVKLQMIHILPGEFLMGCPYSPQEIEWKYDTDNVNCGKTAAWFKNEHPQHLVKITKGFLLGKYEVTQAQWRAVMGDNPSMYQGDSRPVECVSFTDCQQFTKRLREMTGKNFRLPSEAEWEYSCRAGTTTECFWGDPLDDMLPDRYPKDITERNLKEIDKYCWDVRNNPDNSGAHFGKAQEVGLKQPNPWGLFDICGNVEEWCQDWFDENYYSVSPDTDPQGPAEGNSNCFKISGDKRPARVIRGGCFSNTIVDCRSACRVRNVETLKVDYGGVRLACDEF